MSKNDLTNASSVAPEKVGEENVCPQKKTTLPMVIDLLQLANQETEQLRKKIADLLAEAVTIAEASKNKDGVGELVLKLREANQNLVIATFGAQDLQARAEAENQRQEKFLAMLAHELRNPLAPILMATELLEKVAASHPHLPKIHNIIHRQITHLTHLVNDLIDASRINSGKIILQKRATLLSEIIDCSIETSLPIITKRRQQLTIDLPEAPIFIDGDIVRLAQVFSNLLINASKFTPENGNIKVSAYLSSDSVTVSLADDGVGIEKEIQPFIFDLFRQGPLALDRTQGGLGIGLTLVRSIVEMHGGTVSVKSAGNGLGSEFIVVLPAYAQAAVQDYQTSLAGTASNARRILLVEDNADASDALSNLLELEGHTVAVAFDGKTGLALAKENKYDVIICDIGLPGMDGFELMNALRENSIKPEPCYIAMSGYNHVTSKTRAVEAGFDHYLVKPVTTETLMSLIHLASHLK